MKRGRPAKRQSIKNAILGILEKSTVPMTTSAMSRIMQEDLKIHASWNTIQKYVRELVETNQIKTISLPHSKKAGETGLVLYTINK